MYSRPPFPADLYRKFRDSSAALGWDKRGEKWKFLDLLLAYAEEHSDIFRKR